MSDPFEKSSSGRSGSSGKQVMTAVLLGAAFLGVLAFQFRSQPRTAEATPGVAGGSPSAAQPFTSDSATRAIALLADDPTAKLLRGGAVEGPNPLEDVPNNPFILSPQWRSKLTKAPVSKPVIAAAVTHGEPAPVFDASHIQVTMILKQGTGYLAIINGKPMFAGAILAGAKIVEIRADRLVCIQIAHPTAPPFEIVLNKPTAK